MKYNDGYSKIITDETRRELAAHGNAEYPFKYYLEDIWDFDLHCIDWHWHSELEFVLVEKGLAECFIGSEKYELSAGMGIFINSKVIHRFEAKQNTIIPNIVFSPDLLAEKESLIYKKYILPVLDSDIECVILNPQNLMHNEVLCMLKEIFIAQDSQSEAVTNECKCTELLTVQKLLKLWGILFEIFSDLSRNNKMHLAVGNKKSVRTKFQLQMMMQFIHQNYTNQISLEDIATSGGMSRNNALLVFKNNLHTSPIQYLNNYRLCRAAKLLSETEKKIAAIAFDTGFESPAYFCRQFKNLFQMTPKEYRDR
jgi:AraC-like DNA-binding protein/mannose-6-phosphate isomerase-like protein (cupin superfamily)